MKSFIKALPVVGGLAVKVSGKLNPYVPREEQWLRIVMYERVLQMLDRIGADDFDALEISGDAFATRRFKSFTTVQFPQFDICNDILDRQFDLILADQVFEHLLWPYRAARNVHSMLRPGGYFLITTPFLIRVHGYPLDCTRWTETGIKHFLMECGFPEDGIVTDSWGNRACVKGNFDKWARRGPFSSLRNEPNFPVVVWALARKAE